MKLFKCLLLSAALAGGFVGCSDYDDAWIKEAINDLKDRVTTLEEWCKTANSNISALQTLVSALEKNDYVTGVVPVTENGKEIGYTISFKNSPAIIIYHGKNGTDGQTPVIGVAKASDGLYYWTQKVGNADATFILDDKGNKMPASGSTTTATAPRLSVDAEGYWMIDADGKGFVRMKDANGKDVKATGTDGANGSDGSNGSNGSDGSDGATGATGPQGPAGDSIFDEINDSDPDYVLITLKDGTILKLAKSPLIRITAGTLAEKLAGMSNIKELYLAGDLDATDFETLKTLSELEFLDLSKTTITVFPSRGLQKLSALKTAKLPNTLTSIENSAFYKCTGLETIDIPASVTTLGRWIFEDCNNLSTVTLHEGLTTLSASTFYGCGITSISIPTTVTAIPDYAFQGCSRLEEIHLPNTIETIGNGAFSKCGLISVTVPSKVTTLTNAFIECRNLETVVLPDNITSLDAAFRECNKLKSVNVPSKLITIGEDAFLKTAITSFIMGNEVTTIKKGAFSQCAELATVKLSSKLITIGQEAFTLCGALTAIDIPETIQTIGSSAFHLCASMESVTCRATTAPTLSPNAWEAQFTEISKTCKLYVPNVDAYSSWAKYFGGGVNLITE